MCVFGDIRARRAFVFTARGAKLTGPFPSPRQLDATAPPPPLPRLVVGVTGHRESNASFVANRADIAAAMTEIFEAIDSYVALEAATLGLVAPTRLHCLLADGADQMAASIGQKRGWELVAALPFGRALNLAINALPIDADNARALLDGRAAQDPGTEARARELRGWGDEARLFELAERDADIAALYLAKLDAPTNIAKAQSFAAHSSERVALAGRIVVEQSDIIVGIWDGATHSFVGGTGHTIAVALAFGAAVIRVDPAQPSNWHILRAPESLAAGAAREDHDDALQSLVRAALRPGEGGALRIGAETLGREAWHSRSSKLWTGYRRVEAIFGGQGRPFRSLTESYETPDEIAKGSAAALLDAARDLPATDTVFVDAIDARVLRRFAWADGISARLSDAYRGGMIANFMLSACAIVAGIAYQPFASTNDKWIFASVEFLLLCAILLITGLGGKFRWHERWFETRRVAEYFRHAPILLLLGVARPAGRWPKGAKTNWPEYYARSGLRELGLPNVAITQNYLRISLNKLLNEHVTRQRDYHLAKAEKLTNVHHKLDRLSERLFQLAVVSVAAYLALKAASALHLVSNAWPYAASKLFTFLGVYFPTFGAAIAGMRYFGDFERFAAISEVTAEKLDGIHSRIQLLLTASDGALDYACVSELVHATDDIVVSEIENWQAVFGGKHISVPV
jgi:hypothetical protein